MVAGSRSSLRRPTLRGHKSSRSNSPVNNEPPPLLPKSGNEGIALRSKRLRAATITTPEHDLKRRRLSTTKSDIPQLRIPLRSRGGLPKALSPPPATTTPSVVHPKPATNANTAHINLAPIDLPASPGEKSQYDQIRIIEEKARAAIRGGGQSTNHEDRRKLRSEDGGSRAKTELAQYFPDFEEMLSLKPPDPEALTVRTRVVLVDDTPDFEPHPSKSDPFGAHKPLHNTQIIRLGLPDGTGHPRPADPLGEDVYIKIHAKAERHEKQMKNSDRERAQHEKYQLEKLLDDLRGPDWLKTLGISGITDTEKKRYEPKRLLFIRETQALIDKFKRWKEEEKRRKLEREQEMLEAAVLEGEEEQDEGEDADNEGSNSASGVEEGSLDSASTHAPNSSELDALASQQLIEEAKIASKRRKPTPAQWVELLPPKPFTSFFNKRHLRDAAVAGRQRGRTLLAFGSPIPDFSEEEFELPYDILTDEAIKARHRSHRRLRRGAT
ncbi:uncharacterized protein Z520_05362 [Fonsecaea multimorphosa CBS 102226]|uniref:Something about silencing protein 4 domain-containing protein n=1 Tax=Fonsecaea multimorphosa CBS 102226 TaxID=1442371 RepID=A0A0D2IPQ7_9EURO|nr:uncharacterized protein Z520_05362 [Fonsecaea multimorphosa CBS 102226]KIX98901.1 hypothetical protein Z520_05362 [Fonsecaea multimorphosa CBS 102226]OAL25177.1 hypothetical protein AYO22_05054 [Fonsecaea multimorphosa]